MLPLASIAIAPIVETAATAVSQAPRVAAAAETAAASFGDVLQQIAGQTVESLKGGEVAALAGVEGKLPVQNVVSAVMQAERDLHAALALRDKAVAAYQEITHMAI